MAFRKKSKKKEGPGKVGVTCDVFGVSPMGQKVERYTFRNKNGLEMQMINLGCAITSLKVPDRDGKMADVILGYDNIEGYGNRDNPFFGSVLGRVANRLSRGIFSLEGALYYIKTNEVNNTLHGGVRGWDKELWMPVQGPDYVIFSHVSPDGDQGFPGEVRVNVTFQLTDENEVYIRYSAEAVGKPTPLNLTSHPYFNLAGEGQGSIYDHMIQIHADNYLPLSRDYIPTGEISTVDKTVFDFKKPTKIGDRLESFTRFGATELPPEFDGYDNTFCLKGPTGKRMAARVTHPGSGRVMEVFTDQPGMHFYTGNGLNVQGAKQNHFYFKHHGLSLQSMNYPDAVNHPNFPDSVLVPGSTYWHATWYKFSTLQSINEF